MNIAEARSKISKRWRTIEITWPEFLDRLRDPHRTSETVREYKAMTKDDQGKAKECCGGFVGGSLEGGQRLSTAVQERWLLTLDADHAVVGAWETATTLLDYRMACYSTHSSTPDRPRLRWVIPTSRAMTPEEYPAVARRVAQWLNIETMDPTTYEVARLMYWPTCSIDAEYEFHEQDGPTLNPGDVLATYGCGDAWRDSALWPIARGEEEIRVKTMRRAGDPTEKSGIVGKFCRVYDVPTAIDEFLSDVYTECAGGGRYTYEHGTTSGGAVLYQDGKFLYSNHATDPTCGQCMNAFDLVRVHRFGTLDADAAEATSVRDLPSYKAMCQWASELPDVKAAIVQERLEAAERDFQDIASTGADEDDSADWTKELHLNSKTGECDPTIENAELILMHDPQLKGAFGYDEFSDVERIKRGVPWGKKRDRVGMPWSDVDDSGLRRHLEKYWKFSNDKALMNALNLAFDANSYHPVQEYLLSLEWDGAERVDTVFIRHLGAEDTPLNRALTRKWLCGAVARAMRPGCKFDQVLMLLGEQGLGKSTFADILSKGWFTDSAINMTSKDGYDALHGKWIVELGELASTKRSDVETVKTFLSARVDSYRKAYARRTGEYPRQCVFFGTTNEPECLRDRSGNRRFWPISVWKHLNPDALRAEVDQIWAEAYQLWRGGEKLYLTDPTLLAALEEIHEQQIVDDTLADDILNYLEVPLPENWYDLDVDVRRDYIQGNSVIDPEKCTLRRERVCATEIRCELCGEPRHSYRGNDNTGRRISNILNHIPGWRKTSKKRVKGYGPQWVYERTDAKAPSDQSWMD